MSIFHRSAYLTLSALLAIAPACGGDDDDDDGDDTVTPDAASNDEPDAASNDEPDAGSVTPDAAVIEGDEFLLSIELSAAGQSGVVRNRATVAIEGTTAALSLQPLVAPECDEKTAGQLAGDPIQATGIEIAEDGSFTINLVDVVIPNESVGIGLVCGLDEDVVASFDVSGQLLPDQTFCGSVSGMATSPLPVDLTGTFGTVALKPNTPPEELPEPVVACPEK